MSDEQELEQELKQQWLEQRRRLMDRLEDFEDGVLEAFTGEFFDDWTTIFARDHDPSNAEIRERALEAALTMTRRRRRRASYVKRLINKALDLADRGELREADILYQEAVQRLAHLQRQVHETMQ
jgi:hypothetical protein